MADDDKPKPSLVGYGKPPVHSQFPKGKSGNPSGRRKGSRNFSTVLLATLNEKVVINEKGRTKTVSKLEALTKQWVNKAATGDPRAISELARVALQLEQYAEKHAGGGAVLNELDSKTIQGLLKRCQGENKEDPNE
jgi:Family of unknown function (DUF5681)